MKIQQTSVTEIEDGKTQIEMQISDAANAEDSRDYILISTEIPHPIGSNRLQWLQSTALTQVLVAVGNIAEALENELRREG